MIFIFFSRPVYNYEIPNYQYDLKELTFRKPFVAIKVQKTINSPNSLAHSQQIQKFFITTQLFRQNSFLTFRNTKNTDVSVNLTFKTFKHYPHHTHIPNITEM